MHASLYKIYCVKTENLGTLFHSQKEFSITAVVFLEDCRFWYKLHTLCGIVHALMSSHLIVNSHPSLSQDDH